MKPNLIDYGKPRHDSPRVHLLGIAGSGMSALAEIMRDLGWQVNGCDAGKNEFPDHCAGHVDQHLELLLVSDAISSDHPERREASRRQIPVFSYAEMLGQLTFGKRLLAIAGTHGKSTTTAMLAEILSVGDHRATVVYGACDADGRPGGRVGHGRLAAVEACEYRRHFLELRPWQSAILGIEADHFDYFSGDDDLQAAFEEFAAKTSSSGGLVISSECAASQKIAEAAACSVETFGESRDADYRATEITLDHARARFQIQYKGHRLVDVSLQVPGWYNVSNALAAAAVATRAGIASNEIALGLERFRGLRRRLESRGQWRGVELIDDYAHHPTEIDAALQAIALMYPGRRVWCLFQPHQVSRTKHLFDAFARSLAQADRVIVADLFRAREPMSVFGEVTAADLARETRRLGAAVESVYSIDQIQDHLRDQLTPGDVLVTLGAGDIWKLHDEFNDGDGTFHSGLPTSGATHVV